MVTDESRAGMITVLVVRDSGPEPELPEPKHRTRSCRDNLVAAGSERLPRVRSRCRSRANFLGIQYLNPELEP